MGQRDAEGLRRQLGEWIGRKVEGAGMRGAIFGLSGGIDSAVVCGLAAEALGPERCLALIMPIESSPLDAELAQQTADVFGVEALGLELIEPYRALLASLTDQRERAQRLARGAAEGGAKDPSNSDNAETLARANLKPRLRMVSLYYYANLLDYLVVGTGNKDELTVGYFTKWGDGAVDMLPLGDLVKAEVRDLARALGVPAEVIERPPSAGLWEGQTDEAELGFGYDMLDRYLIEGSSGDAEVDAEIERRQAGTRHKLEPAPVARPE